MTQKRRYHERGTVILLAVGILVLLAMIGTTFVIITALDRQEARCIAVAAPMKGVGLGVSARIQAVLLEDLGFKSGVQDGYPYQGCEKWVQQVDFPSAYVDCWLSTPVVNDQGKYAHVSNLYGKRAEGPNAPPGKFENVPALNYGGVPVKDGDRWLVDTDGDGKTDAALVDTSVRDLQGNRFYVAVRIIDLSGRINVNTVGTPSAAVPFCDPPPPPPPLPPPLSIRGNPVTDMDWSRLGFSLSFTDLHKARCLPLSQARPIALTMYNNDYVRQPLGGVTGTGLPSALGQPPGVFTTEDLMAMLWAEDDLSSPNCLLARSRFYATVNNHAEFIHRRHLLTTWNASRILPLQIPTSVSDQLLRYTYDQYPINSRVDLNQAVEAKDYDALFQAFYNAIPRDMMGMFVPSTVFKFNATTLMTGGNNALDALRRALAAQMAVNAIDFADPDSDRTFASTYKDKAGQGRPLQDGQGQPLTVFGIERQPFVTEIFYKKYQAEQDGPVNIYSAVELFNPYGADLKLKNYKAKCGSSTVSLDGKTIKAGGYLVIYSSAAVQVRAGAEKVMMSGLDLAEPCEILQTVGTTDVRITVAELPEQLADPNPNDENAKCVYVVYQRDDRPVHARYSLLRYKRILKDGATNEDDAQHTHDYTNTDDGNSNSTTSNLGAANDKVGNAFNVVPPTPVYVRNGGFINVGDVLRLFYIGPTPEASLEEQLTGMLDTPGIDERGKLSLGRWDVPDLAALKNKRYIWFNSMGQPFTPPGDYVPKLPVACLFSEFLTVNNPADDGVDNNRRGGTDDPTEKTIYGQLNINTATLDAIKCLFPLSYFGGNADQADRVARAILDYRKAKAAGDPLRPCFATAGEVLIPIRSAIAANNDYDDGDPTHPRKPNYKVADIDPATNKPTSDDGFTTGIQGGLANYQILYNRISNMITVRSDTYAAYITVMRFTEAEAKNGDLSSPTAVRQYLAVYDRSECYKPTDWPEVLLFAQIR